MRSELRDHSTVADAEAHSQLGGRETAKYSMQQEAQQRATSTAADHSPGEAMLARVRCHPRRE